MSFSGKNVAGANLRLPLYSEHCMDSSNAGTVGIRAKTEKRDVCPSNAEACPGGVAGGARHPLARPVSSI